MATETRATIEPGFYADLLSDETEGALRYVRADGTGYVLRHYLDAIFTTLPGALHTWTPEDVATATRVDGQISDSDKATYFDRIRAIDPEFFRPVA